MNEPDFRKFIKRSGRSASVIERCVRQVADFQTFLSDNYPGVRLENAGPETLESYVAWVESEPRTSAKNHLWALRYYFDFIGAGEMEVLASDLRQERIIRMPFQINKFRGVNQEHVDRLAEVGIVNVDQMLEAGKNPQKRQELSERTGIPQESILELVKLSDLSRLGAVRSVRARLYHDAGLIPETIAAWQPDELRAMLVEWVEQHGFDGIPPLPKEVQNLVAAARKLPMLVKYEREPGE